VRIILVQRGLRRRRKSVMCSCSPSCLDSRRPYTRMTFTAWRPGDTRLGLTRPLITGFVRVQGCSGWMLERTSTERAGGICRAKFVRPTTILWTLALRWLRCRPLIADSTLLLLDAQIFHIGAHRFAILVRIWSSHGLYSLTGSLW
jgi:hypothetical protein